MKLSKKQCHRDGKNASLKRVSYKKKVVKWQYLFTKNKKQNLL